MEIVELWDSDLIDYFLAHTDWREELWELKAQIMKDTFGEDSDAYKNFIKTRWNAGDGFG